jgi:hypothetical protein
LKILPDISAIKDAGIDYYRQNYFWPVPEDEYHKFVDFICSTYVKLVSKLDNDEVYDIALVEYTFIVSELIGVFHYNYVKSYAKRESLSIADPLESYEYLYPNWKSIGLYYSKTTSPYGVIMRGMRRIIKNIFFNKHLSIFKIIGCLILKPNTAGIGSYDAIKKHYIEKEKIFCDHRDWIDFISLDKSSSRSNKLSNELVKNVIEPFLNTVEQRGTLFTKDLDFSKILVSWRRRASDASSIYTELINSKIKFKRFLVTETVKPYSKLISVALQRKGVSVYCFDHGNDSSITSYKIGNQNERSHCNNFIVPTSGIKNQYESLYLDGVLEKRTGLKFISADMDKYMNLLNANYNSIYSVPAKKVMVIGNPANASRYYYEKGWFFYFKIDLELRIINILRKNGYYVIYKAHPGTASEVNKDIFSKYVDEYILEPYEEIWECADLFVFTDTASSVFGYALTTNRPIILLDHINNKHTESWQMLKKRINVVPVHFDKFMRIQFKDNELLSFSGRVHKEIDNSFVKKIFN